MSEDSPDSVVVRYPGRACLLGEHCDWAGGASLTVPLPLGVRVEARVGAAGTGVSVNTRLDGERLSGRWDVSGSADPDGGPLRLVPAALYALARSGLDLPDTELIVESDLPPGRGFSSSAAFSLAVLDAMARRAGAVLGEGTLAQFAYDVEHDLLGVECGLLDQIACAEAAPVFIQWENRQHEVRPVSPGSTFHLVALALPAPRDTETILAALNFHHAASLEDEPSLESRSVRSAIEVFALEAEVGATALERGDARGLGDAMNRAQDVYERKLDAVLPELRAPLLKATCVQLRAQGALGAKFSGAGGDGSVVALFPDREEAIEVIAGLPKDIVGTAVYCPIG